jgi:predicted ATPase with chaperone activity
MKPLVDVLNEETQTSLLDAGAPGEMLDVEGAYAPLAPTTLQECGVHADVLLNLALKLAYTVPRFNTEWAARKLCLPGAIVGELLDELRSDQLLEVLGQSGPFSFYYAITNGGRERARRLLEISGYIGPAPVSLEAYRDDLEFQFQRLPEVAPPQVQQAIAEMVLPDDVAHVAGLAIMARRSLFLFGPPGNGKTTLGFLLHHAVQGELWIPQCIGVDNNIIRVFDPQVHEPISGELPAHLRHRIDQRWVRVKRPFIVVGGELTIEALDLIYSPAHGYYEAPLHFKANGGTFLLDDFGCQRVEPLELLNRWILPLERKIDYLTLQTGQQLEVPFRQMLIVSTNLDPEKVMSPAFLRRMGYRVFLADPTPDVYAQIFERYAARYDVSVPRPLIDQLIERYRAEGRAMHSCEPRDLIERARDVCRYQGQPLEINARILDLAWRGYFGNQDRR